MEGPGREVKLGRLRHAAAYETIRQCQAEKGWGICWLCKQAGIARASYYQWLIGIPRREEKELNKILQVTSTEPRINRLITAAASNVVLLLLPEKQ